MRRGLDPIWQGLAAYALAVTFIGTLGGVLVAQAHPASTTFVRPLTAIEVLSARCGGQVALDGLSVRVHAPADLRCWLGELDAPSNLSDTLVARPAGQSEWRAGYRATWETTDTGLEVLIQAVTQQRVPTVRVGPG